MNQSAVPEPTNLRALNKHKRRQQIMGTARRLFNNEGYMATRLEQVAEVAEVGVATVYNHFGSKLGLLEAILEADLNSLQEQANQLLQIKPVQEKPADPLSDLMALIEVYYQLENFWQANDVLRQIIAPGLSASPKLDALAEAAETQLTSQIQAVLSSHQKLGHIQPGVNIDDAALVIFSIFNQEFVAFVAGQRDSLASMQIRMKRLIGFVISSILAAAE